MKNNKEEKIDVKIGTADEVLWTKVKEETKRVLEEAEKTIKVNSEILMLAERIISQEKQKMQNSKDR